MRAHPKIDGAVMVIRMSELFCDAAVSAEKDVPLCRFVAFIEGVFSEDRGKVVEVAGRHIAVVVFLVDEHGEGVAHGVESVWAGADWADSCASRVCFEKRAVTGEGRVGLSSTIWSVARLVE